MTYLLDTNACVAYLRDAQSVVARRLAAQEAGAVVLCDPVRAELVYGAWRSNKPDENLGEVRRFFAQFNSLPFDGAAAEVCGRLRAELAAAGTPIGPYDLQIAAIALAHGLVLVTHNVREFARVPGLQVEDWQS